MTRVFVQRGSATAGSSSSSNNTNRSSSSSSSSPPQVQVAPPQFLEAGEEVQEQVLCEDLPLETVDRDRNDDIDAPISEKIEDETVMGSEDILKRIGGLRVNEEEEKKDGLKIDDYPSQTIGGRPYPPPPPAPPPKPSSASSNSRRFVPGNSAGLRIGPSGRATAWPVVSTRTSPAGSRASSPRSHCENDGYNSADEQNSCYGSSYGDAVSSSRFCHYKELNNNQTNTERERQFEIDIRRTKGYEVKRMLEDGNCLFRAVADQVYGDSEAYDLARQMCIDYMERERDHFSQFVTEGFTSYCKRKRRDKVYGNNVEIQALCEMYNRPIHIYSYSTEPINIFHGSYNTDTPPIRLSYHHGNHYNSLVDPRRLTIGAGLGFSCLQGTNVDKDKVKAAIKAQQDQQMDNALLWSDVELTEKEIERMVMEASRAEYMANDKFKQQLGPRESSTSGAEPSSSGGTASGGESEGKVLCSSSSMQMVLSMGFSYLQAMEAYSIFGDDVDSMVCYLLETSSRRKGKATE
ncbi:OTU domain-containing protein 5-B-like isoform X1 [Cynara cardunculus var. scolymus]|uniref:OTU domain-containing protein 5-B-like isoform X1 n=1 Tax=Cynara cardunculus var. scolymus TaxID=59895 RepID=UPI000D62625A|nr:OTU domain-containing protein 5-B-like isoform X1 [Cynara cardunculus var. scolymus]XP_024986785.1 OTU domain-containing protein 5-B-like isoform X1 [Cynara cardunculus var. scolymus]XP_024986786.1 OTU domain-containing protein 5-B-like isoform X1 [Cynara cardunculus var. scolymus]